jgi:hypothetical protein
VLEALDDAVLGLVVAVAVRVVGLVRVLVDRGEVTFAAVVVVTPAVVGTTLDVLEAPPHPASPTTSTHAVNAVLGLMGILSRPDRVQRVAIVTAGASTLVPGRPCRGRAQDVEARVIRPRVSS